MGNMICMEDKWNYVQVFVGKKTEQNTPLEIPRHGEENEHLEFSFKSWKAECGLDALDSKTVTNGKFL